MNDAEDVVKLLQGWAEPWRWNAAFESWAAWRRADNVAGQLWADVRDAGKRAGNFPAGSDFASPDWWRHQAEQANETRDTLRTLALAGTEELVRIQNWLVTAGLFEVAEELPVLPIGDEIPGDEVIRDAAQRMQRVLFRVLKYLSDRGDGQKVVNAVKSVNATPKRPRSSKKTIETMTLAAVAYKLTAAQKGKIVSDADCAKAVGIRPNTLSEQDEWQEWNSKIELAAGTGKMTELKQKFDKRTGEMIVYRDDDSEN